MLMAIWLGLAQAGPWIKEPGQAYVKAGYARFAADTYVDPDGVEVAGTEYVGHNHSIYAEVGLIDHLQLVTSLPFVASRNTIGGVGYINRDFGDAVIGLATGTELGGKVPASLTLSSKLPLYDSAELQAYDDIGANFPALGDGQVDFTALAAVGTGLSLGAFRGWTAAELGYTTRTEIWMGDSSKPNRSYVDGVPWHAQLGWSPKAGDRELGWVTLDASGINNLAQDTATGQYIQLMAGLGAKIAGGVALEAGYSSMVWSRNSSPGNSLLGGVSWSR